MYETGLYNILFPEDLQDPYLSLISVGLESRATSDYYYDNTNRNSDSLLFQYTLCGRGILETKDEIYEMTTGHAFFITLPSEVKYYMPQDNPHDPWIFIFIMIKGQQAQNYYQLMMQRSDIIMTLSIESKVIQTVFNIFNQAKTGHLYSSFYVSELLYRFLCQLCQTQINSEANYSRITCSAIQIMENNYASINSIEEIADILNISFSHFTREFTKEIGTNPIKYLTNIRLTHSVKLLLETSLSIDNVATSCGFSNGNYFTKLFKKHMNLTPGRYRLEWK